MPYKLLVDGKIVPTIQDPIHQNGVVVSYNTRSEVGRAGQVFETLGSVLTQEIEDGGHEGVWEVVDDAQPVDPPVDPDAPALGVEPHEHGDEIHEHAMDFEPMKPDELAVLVRDHGLEAVGTGAGGNVLKRDLVGALAQAHAVPVTSPGESEV